MLYDPVTAGFYSPAIHGEAIPASAVPITDAVYVELLAAQEAGQRITTDAGGYPAAVDWPAPVPATISRFQARAALMQAGLLEQVETLIAAADPMVRLAWQEAVELSRASPTIATLATALGLSEAEVDDLFRSAAEISA